MDKDLGKKVLENVANNPREAENLEGRVKAHSLSEAIQLDEYLEKKNAGKRLKAPFGIKSAMVTTGKYYG